MEARYPQERVLLTRTRALEQGGVAERRLPVPVSSSSSTLGYWQMNSARGFPARLADIVRLWADGGEWWVVTRPNPMDDGKSSRDSPVH